MNTMNQDVAKFIGRPVICLRDTNRGEPVIGFAVSGVDGNDFNVMVLDYVTNTHVEVSRHRLMLFTRQRYDAVFLMDRNSLMSLLYVPFREITFAEKHEFNQAYCNCQLEINQFWKRYNMYLKGEESS